MRRIINIAVTLCLLASLLPAKYHPGIKWREIRDDKFHVVFPKGYETEAHYTLQRAGHFYEELRSFWGLEVDGKIKILLSDVYDESNGGATFFPFNQIEIYLFSPMPDSTLSGPGNWLDRVLVHELVHIFNMNAGSGFTYFLRGVLGSNPVGYPMIYAPLWMTEGLAVYLESQLTRGGRLNTPDYTLMLQNITAAGQSPALGHVYGDPTDWPGPTGWYLYGGAFINYLAETYGKEKIPALVKHYARCIIPLIISRRPAAMELSVSNRFLNIFGKDLGKLWREFFKSPVHHSQTPEENLDVGVMKMLTRSGFDKQFPTPGEDGRVFYVERNYKNYPGVYELRPGASKPRRLIRRAGLNGLSYDKAQRKLYFSAVDRYKSFYSYSDIYRLDPDSGAVKRLTRGRRLFHPAAAGDVIYCIKREKTQSYLARLDKGSRREIILSDGFDGLAHPAVSSDGKRTAAAVKEPDGNWRIGLFSPDGQWLRFVSPPAKKSHSPAWNGRDELYFVMEHEGRYRLAKTVIGSGELTVYHDPRLPSVRHFGLQPGGPQAVVSRFDAGGYNLGRVRLTDLKTVRLPAPGAGIRESGKPVKTDRKVTGYRFLGDLLPKYVTPAFREAGNEYQPGVFVSGTDLLGKHVYEFGGYYGPETRTFNWLLDYTYDGLYPTLRFRYRDYTYLHQAAGRGDFTVREREVEAAATVPLLLRRRFGAWWWSGVYFETMTDDLDTGGAAHRLNFNGFKAGLLFNWSVRYYDAISPSDGFRAAVSYARDSTAMGSDYESNVAALEYKHYIPVFRPNVLAFRLAASDSWGELRRVFYMGGAEPYNGYGLAGDNLFRLMRGYPSGYFSGHGGVLINLEYRMHLFKIERAFLFSRGLERVYLTLFTDIGNLWKEEKKFEPAVSLGAELSLSLLVSDFRYVLSGGAAVSRNPNHDPIFYIRIGTSF